MSSHALLHLLAALAAVILLGHVLSRLLARIHQPPVIGEVLAGILLGPSLIGAEWSERILPPATAPNLQLIAQLGVVLYMFCVGLELNAGAFRRRFGPTLSISLGGIAVPFALGLLLALVLYPPYAGAGVEWLPFSLFVGVSLSITAFPVLARILSDRGLTRTDLGQLALSAAAVGDIVAWCMLAVVVGVATAQASDSVVVLGSAAVYVATMLLVIRPLLRRAVQRWDAQPDAVNRPRAALILVAVLLSAMATEAAGIHALFGAFLLGVLIPHDSRVAQDLHDKLHTVVTVLLLPAFFAYTGMRTRIDLVSGPTEWALCLAIVLVASLGKFGGTVLLARMARLGWRPAVSLGVLMNTRGLMELIVLNIGMELGVISPTLFAMLVIMALATTAVTAPLLRRLVPDAAAATLETDAASPQAKPAKA